LEFFLLPLLLSLPLSLLPPVILATQAEIRRISVQSQPRANSSVRSYLEKPFTKAQGESLEFKPHYQKKKKKRSSYLCLLDAGITVMHQLPIP
jgi:hypothetical protein